MPLIPCPDCDNENSPIATVCPKCGRPLGQSEPNSGILQKEFGKHSAEIVVDIDKDERLVGNQKTTKKKKTAILIIGLLVLLIGVGILSRAYMNSRSPSVGEPPPPAPPVSAVATGQPRPSPTSIPTPEQKHWDYTELDDKMGRGKIKLISTLSTNTISLGFPYEGAQRAELTIRERPEEGSTERVGQVFLSINNGQLLDSDYSSGALVRFDNSKPIYFRTQHPDDGSSDTLFFMGDAFNVFVNRLRRPVKTLRIEVPVYQAGKQVFVFSVDGFTW